MEGKSLFYFSLQMEAAVLNLWSLTTTYRFIEVHKKIISNLIQKSI